MKKNIIVLLVISLFVLSSCEDKKKITLDEVNEASYRIDRIYGYPEGFERVDEINFINKLKDEGRYIDYRMDSISERVIHRAYIAQFED